MYAPQSPLYVGEGPYYEDAYYGSPMRDPYYSAGRPVYDVPPVDYRYRDVPPVIYEEPPVMYQEPPLMLRRYEPSLQGRPKVPKLYVAKISANCLGPWLLLKEIGVPFELVEVDILNGDNHTREFLAMNPMGQVPTYAETDGTVIWESNAIMRFICDRHHVPKHYYPKDVNLKGRIEMALDWRQTVLYPNLAKLCYPAMGFSKDKSRVSEGRENLDKDLRILSDFFLRETPFIGGALPCVADYSIGLPLLLLYATDYRIPAKIREYLENLASKTPAWNEVTEDLKRYIARL